MIRTDSGSSSFIKVSFRPMDFLKAFRLRSSRRAKERFATTDGAYRVMERSFHLPSTPPTKEIHNGLGLATIAQTQYLATRRELASAAIRLPTSMT